MSGKEVITVLIVPNDRSFVTDGNIITDLDTVEPNSENVGLVSWSAGSREGDLIHSINFKIIDDLGNTFWLSWSEF
jgi:hypothetical protein